jgi:hypothetical protein
MKEILTQDWGTLCQRLNEFERGARVDIHWIDRSTQANREIALAAEFEEMSFDKRDGCSDQMIVRAGGEKETRHAIVEPIHVLLRETRDGGGGYNTVTIEAEEGTTILTFHPVIHEGWLKGVRLQG